MPTSLKKNLYTNFYIPLKTHKKGLKLNTKKSFYTFKQGAKRAHTSYLILHYTQITPKSKVLDYFHHPYTQASCHFIVDESGEITPCVPLEKTAWHAGISQWKTHKGLNKISVGIEIVYSPFSFQKAAFPPFSHAQKTAILRLLKELTTHYNLPTHHILGHSDIALDRPESPIKRKVDPGPLFPWSFLREHGYGLTTPLRFVKPDALSLNATFFHLQPPDPTQVITWLRHIGYHATPSTLSAALWSFQCHFDEPWPSGRMDPLTLSRIYTLSTLSTHE